MDSIKEINIHILKITLLETDVYRRFIVKSNITLPNLHNLIQSVMGWTNSHLHQFIANNIIYSEPSDDEYNLEFETVNYNRVKLQQIAHKKGCKFQYEYDFGDGWMHELKVEDIFSIEKEAKFVPICLMGEKACPPEDCGGISGYYEILSAFKEKKNPEHQELFTWLGDDYDPKYFDIDKVNKLLRKRNYGLSFDL